MIRIIISNKNQIRSMNSDIMLCESFGEVRQMQLLKIDCIQEFYNLKKYSLITTVKTYIMST